MLSNAYFLAKYRFDTAENEPAKNLQKFVNFAIFLLLVAPALAGGAAAELPEPRRRRAPRAERPARARRRRRRARGAREPHGASPSLPAPEFAKLLLLKLVFQN